MPKITLQTMGRKLQKNRAGRGIRDVAKEIGISPATLSRIERGNLPDLKTFGKVCKWLRIDPGEVLGVKFEKTDKLKASVHFRKDQTLAPKTAQALAEMILAAQRAVMASEDEDETW